MAAVLNPLGSLGTNPKHAGSSGNDLSISPSAAPAAANVNVGNIAPSDLARMQSLQQQFYAPLMKQYGFTTMAQLDAFMQTNFTPSQNAALTSQFNVYANSQINPLSTTDKILSDIAEGVTIAGATLGAGAALGLVGGATAGATAGSTAATAAPETFDTGALLASNAPDTALGGSLSTDVASGASSLSADPSASVLPDISVGAPDLSGLTAPTLGSSAPAASGLSSYLPKNIISSGLQSLGVPSPIAGAAGGAVQGAGVSTLTGGNPTTGALTGGISGGIGSSGIASGISSDVGGGAGGNALGGAVQSAIGTGAADLVTGANPLNIATSAIGGGVTGATGQQAVGSLASQASGAALSSGTTSTGGTSMSTPNPMMGAPSQVTPPTALAAPTQTATQGLPAVPTQGLPTGTDATAPTPASVASFSPDLSTAGGTPTAPSGAAPTLPDSSVSTAGALPTDPVTAALNSIGTGILGGTSGATSMAPYLAIGAIGLAEASSANSTAQQQSQTVTNLGTPYVQAGQTLLNNAMTGTLTPAQQNLVNSYNTAGNTILNNPNNAALMTIASQAFGDYSSGTLPAGDQLALDQSVAAQKAQVAGQLASMGITDSTILAAQNQQIDNQAMITKQQLLDQQFQTGNQAYTQWLQTTTQGQADLVAGQQAAVTSLQTTLQDALSSGAQGSNDVIQGVQMQIASDAQIGTAVTGLLGSLAQAYAYTSYQNQKAATTTAGSSTGQTGAGLASGAAGAITAPTSLGTPGSMALPTTGSNAVPTGTQDLNNLNVPGSMTPTTVGMTSSDVTDPTTGLPYNSTGVDTSGLTMPSVDFNTGTATGSLTSDQQNAVDQVINNPSTASTNDLVSYFAGTG